MIAELLSAMLESFIYDITSSVIKNWRDKYRWNRFLKMLRKDVASFVRKMRVYILIRVRLITLFAIRIF